MCTENYRWHFDYVRLAWDAGFTFDKYKYSNLDKNKICLVDVERIIKERDVASVERYLSMVVQYTLESDQAELLDTNFVKMFRISQLSVEYLLFCKKYLDNTVVLLKKEISKLKEENKELKLFTEELEGHISSITKHSLVPTFKCDKCPKVFSNEEYLSAHIKRRHSDENKANSETDQLQTEIKQLKERLNVAEKMLQEKDEKVENINDNENKQRVNEILEKFDKFKDKVENDLKLLQMEKNFYEEKYSKLFNVVFESNKKEVVSVVNGDQPVDKTETTTQTDKTNVASKQLQIETVHNKNVYKFEDAEFDSESYKKRNVTDTMEQKINQFEEQIESKISSGLNNIEKQMQAFWGKLSEIELKQQLPLMIREGDQNIIQQEFVQTEPSKPKIKPRMKLSKPTKFVETSEENARKIKAELDKMYTKPEVAVASVRADSEGNVEEITSEHSLSPTNETKSDSESTEEVSPIRKHCETKPSASTLGKRSITSLKEVAKSKEVTEKLREEINNVVDDRLQDIGISSNWKGIPRKTYEKALEIVRHQANLTKKTYPNFGSIRRSIEKSLNKKVEKYRKKNKPVPSTQANVINIRYRKKLKEQESEAESKRSVVTIKNRSLYATDSDSEELEPKKSFGKISEVVPTYSAVVQELKECQFKNVDTDSDVNSVILPKEDTTVEIHTKSVLKNYPSVASLSKKKVLFDIETDKAQIRPDEKNDSISTIGDAVVVKEADETKEAKKIESSLSDFEFSEL